MKRALLIAGGTIGGLGAVLTITPPNLSSTTSVASGVPQANPSAAPSKSTAGQPSKKPSAKPSATAAPTQSAPQPSGATDGTFTGDPISIRYGTVQVKITVQNGKITDAQAVKAPTGSNDRYTQMAVPRLREQTIAAQSANIQGVSGASFTSYGWYKSLVSAVAKAGL
jgi:uncharacterized protein with FMN-binding domain